MTKITKTFFFSQPVFWYVVLFDKNLIVLHHGDNTGLLFWHLYQTHTLAIILTMEKSYLMLELHHKTACRKSGTRDLGLGTWNPYMEPRTRDPSPGTRDSGPIGKTRDLRPLCETQDQGPSTWDSSPGNQDPICVNLDPIPLRGTRDPYLGILTLIQLSLNVQFSSAA